jgi:hypothetical protein
MTGFSGVPKSTSAPAGKGRDMVKATQPKADITSVSFPFWFARLGPRAGAVFFMRPACGTPENNTRRARSPAEE